MYMMWRLQRLRMYVHTEQIYYSVTLLSNSDLGAHNSLTNSSQTTLLLPYSPLCCFLPAGSASVSAASTDAPRLLRMQLMSLRHRGQLLLMPSHAWMHSLWNR